MGFVVVLKKEKCVWSVFFVLSGVKGSRCGLTCYGRGNWRNGEMDDKKRLGEWNREILVVIQTDSCIVVGCYGGGEICTKGYELMTLVV